jgi:hypothetical protein
MDGKDIQECAGMLSNHARHASVMDQTGEVIERDSPHLGPSVGTKRYGEIHGLIEGNGSANPCQVETASIATQFLTMDVLELSAFQPVRSFAASAAARRLAPFASNFSSRAIHY